MKSSSYLLLGEEVDNPDLMIDVLSFAAHNDSASHHVMFNSHGVVPPS